MPTIPPKLLRVITRCTSRPEFLATFGRFVDETSIFVATHQPRPCGVTLPFAVALEDGETMLRGEAEVVESSTEPAGAYHKPGMRLRIVHLDGASRAVHAELLADKGKQRPPTVPPPIPTDATARPDRATPAPETRVPGSSYIVPANPFTQLADEALEYFIECTLYEEATVQPEPRDGIAGGPPPALALSSSDAFAPVAPAPFMAQSMSMSMSMSPTTTTTTAQPTMLVEPLPSPRRSAGFAPAIIAMVGAAIGLGGGFIMWGLHNCEPATTTATTTAAVAPTAVPASAPPPVTAPKPVAAETVAPAAATATAPAPVLAAAVESRPVENKPVVAETRTAPAPSPPGAVPGCHASIVSEPADAAVRIDGAVVGRTPLASFALPCGDHVVAVEHPRYERVERGLVVADGTDSRAEFRLVRPAGVLELQSIPPGATFTLDGVLAGHAPAHARVDAFTFVKVKASLEGYGSWSKRIYVLGPRMTVSAPLEPGRRAVKSQSKPQL